MPETPYPYTSNSLSQSSAIFNPESHVNPFFSSPPESELNCSDSEPEPCDFGSLMDPKFESFGRDCPEEEQDDDDQVRFVTNLFHRSSRDDSASGSSLNLSLGQGIGESRELDLELGLGLCSVGNVASSSKSTERTCRFEGLRVVSIDSDSDSDDGFLRDFDDFDDGFGGVSDFDRPPFCWDYLGFNSRRNNGTNDELRGLDDNIRVHVREIELPGVATAIDDRCCDGSHVDVNESPNQLDADEMERQDREVSILFDSYQERAEQEIMVQSDTDDGGDFDVEDSIRDLEWEILLAVNNFNREVYDMDINVDMYDAILVELEGHMNDWRGSPPTADSVIDNLPTVRFLSKSLDGNTIVCAVCKDDILEEEEVRLLPCSHYYHGDCILPWLKIRNTCPVCRHELPTDDPEYEHQKRWREGLNAYDDVSLNSFDLNQ